MAEETVTIIDEVAIVEENEQVSWVQDIDNPKQVNVVLTNGTTFEMVFPDEAMAKDYADDNTAARKKELEESEDVTVTKIER